MRLLSFFRGPITPFVCFTSKKRQDQIQNDIGQPHFHCGEGCNKKGIQKRDCSNGESTRDSCSIRQSNRVEEVGTALFPFKTFWPRHFKYCRINESLVGRGSPSRPRSSVLLLHSQTEQTLPEKTRRIRFSDGNSPSKKRR